MTPETLGLLAGLLFLLIAVIGGGFKMERVEIPQVPQWARLVSAVLGVVLVAPSVYRSFTQGSPRPEGPPSEVTIYSDEQPETSSDNIRLLGIQVTSPRDPPHGGDRLTIEFTLRNAAPVPVTLGDTHVGVRDPNRFNKDTPEQNIGRTLASEEELRVEATIIVDQKGRWEFWPGYKIDDRYGPPEWRAFEILVWE